MPLGMPAMPGVHAIEAESYAGEDNKADKSDKSDDKSDALSDLIFNLDKEVTAPKINEDVAVSQNKLFKHGRSCNMIKEIIEKFPRPENLNVRTVILTNIITDKVYFNKLWSHPVNGQIK